MHALDPYFPFLFCLREWIFEVRPVELSLLSLLFIFVFHAFLPFFLNGGPSRDRTEDLPVMSRRL